MRRGEGAGVGGKVCPSSLRADRAVAVISTHEHEARAQSHPLQGRLGKTQRCCCRREKVRMDIGEQRFDRQARDVESGLEGVGVEAGRPGEQPL